MGLGTHQHHSGCYAAKLVCRKTAHTHNDDCFYKTLPGGKRPLKCIKTVHEHVADCSKVSKVCTLP